MERPGLRGITFLNLMNDAERNRWQTNMTEKIFDFKLSTERLIIRPFTEADLDEFLAYRNDPEVAKYQGWNVPYSRDQAAEFIEEMKTKNPLKPDGWYQAAIVSKDAGKLIGDAAFFIKDDENRKAYIGCTIMQKYWRMGYGLEVTRRLLSYLFGSQNIHRVVAETDVDNIASYMTLEKIGFRREAHLIENIWFKGHWASEYHYAMLDREWERINTKN